MDSSKTIQQDYKLFNQKEYDNVFFFCDGTQHKDLQRHPFIAFTTCFCPLCDANAEISRSFIEVASLEEAYENLNDSYYHLIAKASKYAPELLI